MTTEISFDRPPRPGRAMRLRFALAGVTLVLLSAGATATVGLEQVSSVATSLFPKSNHITAPKGVVTAPAYDGAPETFLVIGSDKRAQTRNLADRESPPRSDTLLLVRFDPQQHQTSVMSIPRDLIVNIRTRGHTYFNQKINAAYSIGGMHGGVGGATLAAETVERVLGKQVPINGVIDVSFAGFLRVVGALNCVYVNVDHRYYNFNDGSAGTDYANIDLQPGYQKLCYTNALAYVRYREDDSDFVRVARQQDFLRALREQVSVSGLLSKLHTVAHYVGDSITSTLGSSSSQLISLTKLIAFSQSKPLRQVQFRKITDSYVLGGGSYVQTSPKLVRETVDDFLNHAQTVTLPTHPIGTGSTTTSSTSSKHHHSHHRAPAAVSPASLGLYPTPSFDEDQAVSAVTGVPFKVLYPGLQTGVATQQAVHAYSLRDRKGNLHHAYVDVWQQTNQGGYYDVEGTDWLNPPLIDHPTQILKTDHRRYMLIDDGSRIHVIAWIQNGVLYWVNNTLLEDLTNRQMIAIANSVDHLR